MVIFLERIRNGTFFLRKILKFKNKLKINLLVKKKLYICLTFKCKKKK